MGIKWSDMENNIDDCVTICKKDRITIFRIIEGRYGYYADYFDNRLFTSPNLSYLEAAQISKTKLGNDSLENRLIIAKEFFLDNYREQIFNTIFKLEHMSV